MTRPGSDRGPGGAGEGSRHSVGAASDAWCLNNWPSGAKNTERAPALEEQLTLTVILSYL